MASKARKPVEASKEPEKGPVAARYPQAEIEEATKLLAQALQRHKRNLDSIYLFPLNRSLPSLRHITDQMAASYKGNAPLAVTQLIHWLGQIPEASTGKTETKAAVAVQYPTSFTQTLELREKIHAVLQLTDGRVSDRFGSSLARWIVTNWGGVDRQRQESCKDLFVRAQRWQSPEKLGDYEKVARWSKVLAFCRPHEAAIFDARVVYSLNWYLRRAKKAKRFPTLPSENSMIDILDHSGFVARERMGLKKFAGAVFDDIRQRETGARIKSQIRRLIEGSRDVVSEEDAYPYYLKIMSGVAMGLFGDDVWRITKTEMMLFGLATTAVAREVCQALYGSSARP